MPRNAGDYDYDARAPAYTAHRRPDPRFAAAIHAALGDARTVLNVGAGAGAYEPADRYVLAVEPSRAMRALRPPAVAPAIDAVAEALPLDDRAVDAAMAILTVHQWRDVDRGLAELRRVTRGPVVIMTFDPGTLDRHWLADYAPTLLVAERRRLPPLDRIRAGLGGQVEVRPLPIPIDCTDGFIEAFYARPEMLLDPSVRAGQSAWGFIPDMEAGAALDALRADLASGAWDARYGELRRTPTFDGSLRLLISDPSP